MASENLFSTYDGISRYSGVPTEQLTGRLHYNENLYGPSPKCIETLSKVTPEDLYIYESGVNDDLTDAISKDIGIPSDNLFLNNGSAENIKSILSIFTTRGDTILLPNPGWSYYFGLTNYKFLNVVTYPILEDGRKCRHDVEAIKRLYAEHKPKLIIITSPAMPTGNKMNDSDIEDILDCCRESIVLLDEAYLGFAPYTLDVKRLISKYDNLVFSRTFSKYYGLANLRIGYGIASKKLKDILFLDLPLHRIPHISKRMAIAAIEDKEYYLRVIGEILSTRQMMQTRLNRIPGVLAFDSDSNFLYIKLTGYNVEDIKAKVAEKGYLIRIFNDSSGEKHLRITVGKKNDMELFIGILEKAILESKI